MKKIILLIITIFVIGCEDKKPEPTIPTPEPTPQPTSNPSGKKMIAPRWEVIKGKNEYTQYAIKHLEESGQYLLNGELQDLNTFCTKCENIDRLEFMVYLLSLMAEHESYFRPSLEYKESFKNSKGDYVISTGLFQISLESSQQKRYSCGFTKQSDLYSPEMNIRCAIRILNALSKEDKRIKGNIGGWKGGSRYWSVLRYTRAKAYNDIMKKMKEAF